MASSVQNNDGNVSGGATNNPGGPKARLLLQQCLSGRLMVKPAEDDMPAEYVTIQQGLVAYVCFLKGADKSTVSKMVKLILTTRLSEKEENGKRVSVADLPGDILIIPQATLGGKTKGKMMQYHQNIDKTTGLSLYQDLCSQCTMGMESTKREVKWGTYGNRQVFSMETNGPYTHMIEISD